MKSDTSSSLVFALFLIWLTLNLLDMVISGIALRYGATEIGIIFQITRDYQVMCFIKGIGAFLYGGVLLAHCRKGLLAFSCGVYLLINVWNGWVLVSSMR